MTKAENEVKRYGMVIGVKPEKLEEYKRLHANPWPEVIAALQGAHVRNFSIYLGEVSGAPYLFAYLEYTGENLQADLAKLPDIPKYREWLAQTDPCQTPLPNRKPGEWWMRVEEIFHME